MADNSNVVPLKAPVENPHNVEATKYYIFNETGNIMMAISSLDEGNQQGNNGRSEDALYTFVCKQRFDYLEKRMERMRKSFIDSQTSNAS
ncbi:MAG: hypothetical protein P8016_10610 [Sedimentisphaerales bacterium]